MAEFKLLLVFFSIASQQQLLGCLAAMCEASLFRFRSSSPPRVYDDYYFFGVEAGFCFGVVVFSSFGCVVKAGFLGCGCWQVFS